VGRKRVARLMRRQGWRGRVVRVTRRQPGLKRFLAGGENLRKPVAPASQPNEAWVADITYLRVCGKWMYLAAIMDVYSRRIIGWSMAKTRTTALTLTALRHAMRGRRMIPGGVFHTDRGIEYRGLAYQERLRKCGIRPSVNRPGYCTDNAHMESFFHSLKAELIRGERFETEGQLRGALSGYINRFYNHRRMHSGIGYHTPAEFERIIA
jgi:putative transposase